MLRRVAASGRTVLFRPPRSRCWLCSAVVRQRSAAQPVAGLASDALLDKQQPASPASHSHATLLRQITLALAPPDQVDVELPEDQKQDLDELYGALMKPLPRIPTQKERVDKLRAVVEAEDADAFFALPHQDRADAESHAHRIRCLGAQEKLDAAHAAFAEMGTGGAPPPDSACFHALADACARAGAIDAAEAVLAAYQGRGWPLTAPLFTSLVGAHRRAGTEHAVETAADILSRVRFHGVVEDAPLHTSLICWFLDRGMARQAWALYHDARGHGVRPDAVTYTAMMGACAREDRIEQARILHAEMALHGVSPTLATHNAYITVCAARAASLVELPERKHRELRRLKVDLDVQTPIRDAEATFQRLLGEGHHPDGHTYLGLLKVAAGAADVPRAQAVLTRMLDAEGGAAMCHAAHFHQLLRACWRALRFIPDAHRDAALRVAAAVPPSMGQLGLRVSGTTIDYLVQCHAACRDAAGVVRTIDEAYAAHGLAPGKKAFDFALRLAERLHMPQLAADLLERMGAAGVAPTRAQRDLPRALSEPTEVLLHPAPAKAAWSAADGYYRPELAPRTRDKWTVWKMPREGGADDAVAAAAVARREAAAALAEPDAAGGPWEGMEGAEEEEEEEGEGVGMEEELAVPVPARRGRLQGRHQREQAMRWRSGDRDEGARAARPERPLPPPPPPQQHKHAPAARDVLFDEDLYEEYYDYYEEDSVDAEPQQEEMRPRGRPAWRPHDGRPPARRR